MRRLFAVLIVLTAATIAGAQTLGETRSRITLDDGTVLVSRPATFDVVALRDRDGDGRADEIRTAVSSVEGASGLAFRDGTLYVAGSKRIVAADRLPDGSFGPWRDVVTDLPGGAAPRVLAVAPNGRIYVSIEEQRALWEVERDGLTRRVYARDVGEVGAIAFDDKGVAHVAQAATTESGPMSLAPEPACAILAREFALPDLEADAVLHDEEQDVYFVAGRGFIARVSPEGKVLEPKFIDGVKIPRGMAIRGLELWIADGTAVRVFNRVTGHILKTVELAKHGAVDLDGVAIGGDDAVYVTDSAKSNGDGRIFRIGRDGKVEVAIHGEELRSPAGIAWDGTRFLVAQAYGNEIMAWQPGHPVTAVLRGPGAYDGLTILPNGVVITASANDDALHFGTTGDLRPLFAHSPAPAGIAFDRKRNRLLIAGSALEAWTLPPMTGTPPARTAKERPTEMARSGHS